MSIRLRLTLLYSIILALTLIAFGSILYVTQSQATYNAIKSNLAQQVAGFANPGRRPPPGPSNGPRPEPTPNPGTVATLPGRWTQIRDSQGKIVGRTADLADTPLPLSDAGLNEIKSGQPFVETADVDSEPLMIYSQPFTNTEGVVGVVQVAAVMTEREQSLATLRFILLAGSALVIVVAFGVGWVLSGMALDPIHRITQTAQAIGHERNFARRVQHQGPNDEIGQLAVTINTMLTELESTYRQVETALDTQRRFVADASHELRTPLTTVRGNIELLRHDPPMEPREAADVLADTNDEVERLIRLVHQLLVLARADAGRPLRCKPVPIQPLMQDVYRQAQLLAPDRKITADIDLEALALADRDALKQVVLILVDNAVAHTPPDAAIHMASEQSDGRIRIRVQDTGAGIAAAHLPHIFERFYRGDAARSGGGTGLGLSIAKELVQGQCGEISVASEMGKGTTFTVTLPCDG